ncbi:TIM barrel protein [Actinosynnema sp. NPDC047251]|uniref:Sugar phosphate isomerase/epimerase n=1 Tax=Saccharothrix espanaensis (strain ATCC 51144 / DSM 44229 / JCM 9112 / NBRC 15066 / NRRL 15764) TaxID=1179773 RepID=K0K248_SACES|nr:TIM barrel protein [Saccharothrix espanaensis]CCH30598.1 Sugar phosphate isomerase/epimerase [Saccharothrix espanaensis DSM 44229]
MITAGLASVTFRGRPVDHVVGLAADAGLGVVEWAGDAHVPPGDLTGAARAARLCRDRGLAVGTYGSYYKPGHSDPADFGPVLAAAEALGAPRIRVWAGVKASADVAPAERGAITDDLRRCVELAAARGLAVTAEHHVCSLTDELGSAVRLLAEVDLVAHWQPRESPDVAVCLSEVAALLPRLAAVHAFSWGADGFTERLPLAARADLWQPVLAVLAQDGRDRDVLLEFVPDDSPEAFHRDAATLLSWLENAR